jgi:hypothetical protein
MKIWIAEAAAAVLKERRDHLALALFDPILSTPQGEKFIFEKPQRSADCLIMTSRDNLSHPFRRECPEDGYSLRSTEREVDAGSALLPVGILDQLPSRRG